MTVFHQLPDEPQVGDILLYKMRPEELPTNPEWIWHGLIKHVLVEMFHDSQPRYYIVQSVEHPDCEEWIYPSQITGCEKQPVT